MGSLCGSVGRVAVSRGIDGTIPTGPGPGPFLGGRDRQGPARSTNAQQPRAGQAARRKAGGGQRGEPAITLGITIPSRIRKDVATTARPIAWPIGCLLPGHRRQTSSEAMDSAPAHGFRRQDYVIGSTAWPPPISCLLLGLLEHNWGHAVGAPIALA